MIKLLKSLIGSMDISDTGLERRITGLGAQIDNSSLTDAQKDLARKFNQESMDEGNVLTREAMEGVLGNIEAGQKAGMGLAANTTTGTSVSNFFGGNIGIGSSAVAGGGLGLLGAAVAGGDKTEGAAYGAIAGMSIGGASRALTKNILDVEKSFMKDLLGKNYTANNITTTHAAGTLIKDMDPNIKLSDLGLNAKNFNTVGEYLGSLGPRASKSRRKSKIDYTSTTYARSENLNALNTMKTDDLGMIDSYKRDLLLGKKKLNVGKTGRVATGAGAFLGGMAISSSDKRDYRRGFNKGRGNRI